MISLIICSRKSDIPEELKNNIAQTIGTEYELIVIDNSDNKYSIFTAYNEGVHHAKGEILCFMHEDILFHTNEWGKNVAKLLEDNRIGVVGLAGGHYQPQFPAPWWQSGLKSGTLLQGSIENGKYIARLDNWNDFLQNKDSIEVVSVDGLWFCMPKSLFSEIEFDEKTFAGFHCYDLDICLQVRNIGYKVVITSDILVEHKSMGNTDETLVKNLFKCYFKWKDKLPQIAGITLNEKQRKEIDGEIWDYVSRHIDKYYNLQRQLEKTLKFKAYRLGKLLLNRINVFRKRITTVR